MGASLDAPDQLRQRVAWALSQIFVVSEAGLTSNNLLESEIWGVYYDIFVRNAFGNYRDIMREVRIPKKVKQHSQRTLLRVFHT